MSVVTMTRKQPDWQTIPSMTLGATLHELCRHLAASPMVQANQVQLSEDECAALAFAAQGGHPGAEFLVGSIFDAAGNPDRAMEWYRRSASGNYLPAVLQLVVLR